MSDSEAWTSSNIFPTLHVVKNRSDFSSSERSLIRGTERLETIKTSTKKSHKRMPSIFPSSKVRLVIRTARKNGLDIDQGVTKGRGVEYLLTKDTMWPEEECRTAHIPVAHQEGKGPEARPNPCFFYLRQYIGNASDY